MNIFEDDKDEKEVEFNFSLNQDGELENNIIEEEIDLPKGVL